MGHVIVGTAGHIDHGKSSLVRALTGTDPDRLPEEKRRQITIDLGYAFLDDVAAIIDVPGHEKFIHNMVAGASTIDYALLVIAADDGVMPQTREHLHILRLLGIRFGAIVITKIDCVDSSHVVGVKDQIRNSIRGTFLVNAPIFEVDSLSGWGVSDLRVFLVTELPKLPVRSSQKALRIPIDRVFSVRGHGTVVTGTVLSGTIAKDMRVEILPGSVQSRVKQLQSNMSERSTIGPGMRVAANLASVDSLTRGQTITSPEALTVARKVAARVESLQSTVAKLRDRQRVRCLIGTQEVMGRYRVLARHKEYDIALLLLDSAIVTVWGDRFILRNYSPVETLGGGIVLDIDPMLKRLRDRTGQIEALQDMRDQDDDKGLLSWIKSRSNGVHLKYAAQVFGLSESLVADRIQQSLAEWLFCGKWIMHRSHVKLLESKLLAAMQRLHESSAVPSIVQLAQLVPAVHIDVLSGIVSELAANRSVILDGSRVLLPGADAVGDPRLRDIVVCVMERLSSSGFTPPSAAMLAVELQKPRSEIERALVLAVRQNMATRLGNDLFFERDAFARALAATKDMITKRGSIQVADVTKHLNSSRKYVVPFLEYLDSVGITERRENFRVAGRNFKSSE
ncbi:selenocysteine-specific translation elongation factor [bacterium]|nr:selenocysteine-specific translation elongation factor [bacterium]